MKSQGPGLWPHHWYEDMTVYVITDYILILNQFVALPQELHDQKILEISCLI